MVKLPRIISGAGCVRGKDAGISDSGDGVPAEIADRVWEHGFSTKPAGVDGRGVGLALVRSIVEGAGGHIEVTASPTAFRVTLPARRA